MNTVCRVAALWRGHGSARVHRWPALSAGHDGLWGANDLNALPHSHDVLGDQQFHVHAVLPDAVEFAVLFVHADLLEAHAGHQREAGAVVGEDAGIELPEAALA